MENEKISYKVGARCPKCNKGRLIEQAGLVTKELFVKCDNQKCKFSWSL